MFNRSLIKRIFKSIPGILLVLIALALLTGCVRDSSKTAVNRTDNNTDRIKIAAASDVQPAFEELGKIFKKQTGVKPVFVFGSSGQIAQQIIAGANIDIFASADEAYVDKVIASGVGVKSTKQIYALGRLAIVSGNKKIKAPSGIWELRYMKSNKIAIANPDHAPYGKAARDALTNAGIWKAVSSRIIMGENARQAYQYAQTGNSDIALVPLSLVKKAPDMSYTVIPESMHGPIQQTLVLTKNANRNVSLKFIDLLLSEKGIEIMKEFGFEMSEAGPKKGKNGH